MPISPLELRLSVAPMMDWTDPACRYLLRLISRHTRLYTEMVPAQALWHNDPARFLSGDPSEHPVALQLGGADVEQLAYGTRLGTRWGYDEINLNVGCPSERVRSGRFGACLMREPALVGNLVRAMREETDRPVTVKCRIGVDHDDDYSQLSHFTESVLAAGVTALIVHARKAWLNGLSPKQNREIPPLRYDRVAALKADFPELPLVLNGGIRDLETCGEWLQTLDGVMVGREAYHNPWLLAFADRRIFADTKAAIPDRVEVARHYRDYVVRQHRPGVPISRFTRHLSGLFQGLPGARVWRRALSEGAARPGAGPGVIDDALAQWQAVMARRAEAPEAAAATAAR